MDFKKFLKDNKGCPLTVPAIKQLLVKFIELMSKKGVVKEEASDIKELSKETLDELQVGDIVQKITGNQKHAYMVTYKGEGAGEGICLTYCAAGYMETVSYDRSGDDWVYNSTDVVNIEEALADKQDKLVSGENIKTVGGTSLLGSGDLPISSLTLLSSAQLPDAEGGLNIGCLFTNIDRTKITSKTLLIFTYDNCFVLGMLGQTGIGKVCGLIRHDWSGYGPLDYTIAQVTFQLTDAGLYVETNVGSGFTVGTAPIAYLFALTLN